MSCLYQVTPKWSYSWTQAHFFLLLLCVHTTSTQLPYTKFLRFLEASPLLLGPSPSSLLNYQTGPALGHVGHYQVFPLSHTFTFQLSLKFLGSNILFPQTYLYTLGPCRTCSIRPIVVSSTGVHHEELFRVSAKVT